MESFVKLMSFVWEWYFSIGFFSILVFRIGYIAAVLDAGTLEAFKDREKGSFGELLVYTILKIIIWPIYFYYQIVKVLFENEELRLMDEYSYKEVQKKIDKEKIK